MSKKKRVLGAPLGIIRTTPITQADMDEVIAAENERAAALAAIPKVDLHELNMINAMKNLPSSLK